MSDRRERSGGGRPTVVAILRALRSRGLADQAQDSLHAWNAACPLCWRPDDRLTLRVTEERQDGPARVRCIGGCAPGDVLAALGLDRAGEEPGTSHLRIVRASEVEVEPVRFLIPERVPCGAVTLLAGDPGLGKSTLTCEWAAGVSAGRYGDAGAVLIANAEDSPSYVVVPRLAAADAELELVEFFSVDAHDGTERPFTLPDDVPRLEAHARRVGARLVVVDPLAAFLADNVSTKSDHSVRRALAPLAAMASRLGIGVVVVCHLNKSAGADALYRVGGSIGLVGGARSLLVFTRDPDDPDGDEGVRRALGHAKSNWGALAETTIHEHEAVEVTVGETTVETHRLVAVGVSEINGAGLLGADRDDPPATQRERAVELLADLLGDGEWKRAKTLKEAATNQGLSTRTLQRAAREAGVEDRRTTYPGVTWWRLPASRAMDSGASVDGEAWRDCESSDRADDSALEPEQSRHLIGDGATGAGLGGVA